MFHESGQMRVISYHKMHIIFVYLFLTKIKKQHGMLYCSEVMKDNGRGTQRRKTERGIEESGRGRKGKRRVER